MAKRIVTGTMELDDDQLSDIRDLIRKEELAKIKAGDINLEEFVRVVIHQYSITELADWIRYFAATVVKIRNDPEQMHFDDAKKYKQLEIVSKLLEF